MYTMSTFGYYKYYMYFTQSEINIEVFSLIFLYFVLSLILNVYSYILHLWISS